MYKKNKKEKKRKRKKSIEKRKCVICFLFMNVVFLYDKIVRIKKNLIF
jgi:hypothetical protein